MGDLPWLRLYTDTVDNEKIRLLAFEDRWHFIALLCLKQQGVLSGSKGLMDRKIAVKLGLQLEALDELKRRLIEVDLILDDWTPKGWEKHQFVSDSSTSRVRKYRERKKKDKGNVTETLQKRPCNAIDTDTEEDTDKENKESKYKFLDDDMKAAKYIYSLLVEINNKHKQPNFDSWANTIRLMRERDDRTHKEIVNLFRWCTQDPFWVSNILSPDKLRQKWDQLTIQKNKRTKERQDNKPLVPEFKR